MIETGQILSTKVLVKPSKIEEKKTASGIILSEVRKLPNISGTVVKTGSGTDQVKMEVREGDTILYYERSALPIVIDDENYSLLDIREILFFWR